MSVLLCLVTSIPALAQGTGFSLRPANPDPALPASASYFVYTLAPGGSKTDEVLVLNAGTVPQTLDLYAVDALTGSGTGAVYGARSPAPKGVGTWVRVSEPRVTVPPGSTARVFFDVQVPPDAAPGQYLGGIVAQPAMEASPTAAATAAPKEGQFTITTTTRVVVALAVTVPGAIERKLTVTGVRAEAGRLVVGVRNDGNALIKPRGRLVLRDAASSAERLTLPLEMDTLLPGGAADFAVPWPADLAPGNYTADVQLDSTEAVPGATPAPIAAPVEFKSGTLNVQPAPTERAAPSLAPPRPPTNAPAPVAASGLPEWAPYAAAAAIVLLAANLVVGILVFRRLRR